MELLEALVQFSLLLCMGCSDGLKRILALSGLAFSGRVRVLILLSWLGWVGWIPPDLIGGLDGIVGLLLEL